MATPLTGSPKVVTSIVGSSRNRVPSGMASAAAESPSVRLAGATCVRAACTTFTASAWSILPACSSETLIAQARYDRPDAATPYGYGNTPCPLLTFCSRPPQHADQEPSAARWACQSSHSVSVEGCQTTREWSVPFAGCAL